MLTIYSLKADFQKLLRPLVARLANIGVTANIVTIGAILLSVSYGGCLIFFHHINFLWVFLPAIFFIRMSLNAIDGMLAREFGQKSNLGALLNEMGDVTSDTALFLPFAFLYPSSLWPVIIFCILAIMSEMIGVVAVQIGALRRYDGPMGKSDRVFVIGLAAFCVGCGWISAAWIPWVFLSCSIFIVLTIFNRGYLALKT